MSDAHEAEEFYSPGRLRYTNEFPHTVRAKDFED